MSIHKFPGDVSGEKIMADASGLNNWLTSSTFKVSEALAKWAKAIKISVCGIRSMKSLT